MCHSLEQQAHTSVDISTTNDTRVVPQLLEILKMNPSAASDEKLVDMFYVYYHQLQHAKVQQAWSDRVLGHHGALGFKTKIVNGFGILMQCHINTIFC